MSDTPPDDTAELSEPRRWRISPVWLIPLAAALIGGWLVYDNFTSRGPVIKLDMDTAEGIDAGNTGGAFGRPTFIPAEPRFYGVQLTARIGR